MDQDDRLSIAMIKSRNFQPRLAIGLILAVTLDTAVQLLWKMAVVIIPAYDLTLPSFMTILVNPLFIVVVVLMGIQFLNWLLLLAHTDLRVCPRSFCFSAKLSQHEADRGPSQERQRFPVKAFPILGQPAAAVEPADGSLDDPAFGQYREGLCSIRSLDDLQVHLTQDAAEGSLELRSLVASIGVELEKERIEAEQTRHDENAAIAILNVRCVDNGVHQQALRIDKDVALLAFDFLARIVPARVDATPPFSALFTL